jgi:hypothetical protein
MITIYCDDPRNSRGVLILAFLDFTSSCCVSGFWARDGVPPRGAAADFRARTPAGGVFVVLRDPRTESPPRRRLPTCPSRSNWRIVAVIAAWLSARLDRFSPAREYRRL